MASIRDIKNCPTELSAHIMSTQPNQDQAVKVSTIAEIEGTKKYSPPFDTTN
jgi:hypothetical protein